MWIVVISYSTMFIYIGIAIGQFPSFVFSGFTLAIIGILIVLASVISSMGVIAIGKDRVSPGISGKMHSEADTIRSCRKALANGL